jgi:glycosyltransferase involved in cell wall biosynthesis
MRLAWFSPLPPTQSGIAAYSSELLPIIRRSFETDTFAESTAHDFVWKQRREPYDLVVYQLGNAPCHDYQWGYLARYPGLVVLHDARLHHARARQLLGQERFDDYRREFWYDHPDASRDFVEYAVEGLGGSIYYFWSMLRVVMRTARTVAVHSGVVATELQQEYPGTAIATIRMGVPCAVASEEARRRGRDELGVPSGATLFAAFGKVTPEKRIGPILGALNGLRAEGIDAYLLLVGDTAGYRTLEGEIAGRGLSDRVRTTGYVPDERVGDYLAAADACLCLRWPTALESSASWLRCLSAARPTVVSELAHLAEIPTLDPNTWRPSGTAKPVAVGIDLLDEDRGLLAAMRRLATDRTFRDDLGRSGLAYWQANHTLELMASDYQRVIAEAARRAGPAVADLPAHFTTAYADTARQIARQFGVDVDILRSF